MNPPPLPSTLLSMSLFILTFENVLHLLGGGYGVVSARPPISGHVCFKVNMFLDGFPKTGIEMVIMFMIGYVAAISN